MKISLDWLGEHVTWIEKHPQAIADRLSLATAEVEGIEEQGGLLNHCCVGEVLTIAKHPNADKLSVVMVKTDKGEKKVVCGGTNLREGMKVAFAHVGATVKWHGGETMTLAPVKIRGEESFGMICASEELGLEAVLPPKKEDGERPIADLGARKTGQSLKDAFGGGDTVLDINNTAITTRPDLWSHLGIARECVALGMAKWKGTPKRPTVKCTKDPLPFKTVLESKTLVPRYQACVLEISGPGETPSWMRSRLEATGWQSINLPVDITNYVAMELGIPLHAFDADSLKGTVKFRTAKEGEKIVTLDGVERVLPKDGLVLSDDLGIFDLMGIMGGKRSGTTEKTKRIYLHAATVDPAAIRKTIQATGLRTHAATVYEKGVPAVAVELGLRRAIELFLELVPGARIASKLEDWGTDGKAPAIALPLERLHSMLGEELKEKTIIDILESLGCTVKRQAARSKTGAASLTVTPPLWRLKDLTGPHDLLEEVARVYGYEKIREIRPRGVLQPLRTVHTSAQVHDVLAADGCIEIVPLSLVGPALLRRAGFDAGSALTIKNPIADDLSLLRPSALPSLLEHAERNILQAGGSLDTFHCGHVFAKDGTEHTECGILSIDGTNQSLTNDPFLRLIERVSHLLRALGHEPTVAPADVKVAAAHPGRSAAVSIGSVRVASVFELRPTVCEAFGIRHRAVAALIDVAALERLEGAIRKASPIPAHPAIVYDVTFPRSHGDAMGPLLQKLKKASSLLEDVAVHDLYASGKGPYNATLRFTYRAADRTLTEGEAKQEHEKVLRLVG